MSKSVEEQALEYMKDAFRRYLLEQLGPMNDKPLMELRAWSLALREVASVVESCRRSFEDETFKQD